MRPSFVEQVFMNSLLLQPWFYRLAFARGFACMVPELKEAYNYAISGYELMRRTSHL